MDEVQVYLDFARSLPGHRYVETRVHRPEFHPLFYGTLDFAAVQVTTDVAHFVDYKHGEGVLVEVYRNPQLMYYVYGFIAEDKEEYPDAMEIYVHIVQPRGAHPDGPIRTWETTAGETRAWAHEVLLPAMQRTVEDRYLSVGEWCRFCPAKAICPAMGSLSDEMTYHRETPLPAMPPALIGELYAKAQIIKMFIKAIEEDTARRVLGGEAVPGVKAVAKKASRVFKEGTPLVEKFGEAAYAPRELLSPPKIERLPEGKAFVAEWAYSPQTGLTIALESDKRAAVPVKSGAETFGAALEQLTPPVEDAT